MGESYFTSPGALEAAGLPVTGLRLLRQRWLVPGARLRGVLCSGIARGCLLARPGHWDCHTASSCCGIPFEVTAGTREPSAGMNRGFANAASPWCVGAAGWFGKLDQGIEFLVECQSCLLSLTLCGCRSELSPLRRGAVEVPAGCLQPGWVGAAFPALAHTWVASGMSAGSSAGALSVGEMCSAPACPSPALLFHDPGLADFSGWG